MKRLVGSFAPAVVVVGMSMLSATPVFGQTPKIIEPGRTITAKGGTADAADFYAFAGESGGTVTLEARGKGPISLMLFTSAGEQILTANGKDRARLEVILPATDAYLLAVGRGELNPYTLGLEAIRPDPHLALFARHIGFAYGVDTVSGTIAEWSTCWVEPGVVYRFTINGIGTYHELLRGWRENTYYNYPGAPTSTIKIEWDGQTATRVEKYSAGNQRTWTHTVAPEAFGYPTAKKDLRYKGYLCS